MATKKARGPRKSKSAVKPVSKVSKPRVVADVLPPEEASFPTLPFEIDPRKIEASLNKLKDQMVTLHAVLRTGSATPMQERYLAKTKPAYADYMRRVPGFFPWTKP